MHGRPMTTPKPDAPIACLLCESLASPADLFCSACGALLPDSPSATAEQQLDLELLFSYRGRIGRREYLITAIVLSVFLVVALGLLAAMSGSIFGAMLGGILSLNAAFALTCATIKRLHDIDTTGWLSLIGLVPVIGWVFIVVLALIAPSKEQNTYGLPHGGSIRP